MYNFNIIIIIALNVSTIPEKKKKQSSSKKN